MQGYQKKFLEFVISQNILRFGEFTLKSGRVSPYFFNAGLFNTGSSLTLLAECYANAIVEAGIEFDIMFGPAYKGIPLVTATAQALVLNHGIDKPYCFNRKEVKSHGEGGSVIGAPLQGKVLIIDDVVSSGMAVREAAGIIKSAGAQLAGIAVAMDRQERGNDSELSAIQEIENEYKIKVISIITLSDIMDHLTQHNDSKLAKHLNNVMDYKKQYGA
ncbi:MAG: orotate phosphoribosyltransferase [Pseudohongiellaceae bacterium]